MKASFLQIILPAARWIVGGVFIYMGLSKALHPVDFLKILREFQITDQPLLLNLIAAALPWFEVICGLLLLMGVAVRGSALVLVALLVPFTAVVLRRALAIHNTQGIPFCAVSFDCGCGAGEILICRKLLENSLLIFFSGLLLFGRSERFCLRFALKRARTSESAVAAHG